MDRSPYLQALERIPGSTSSEKYQALYGIAQRQIREWKNNETPIEVYPSAELPEPLVPRVKLEIGLILKRPDDVIAGLKSNNQEIFFRAVNVKRFFKMVGTKGYPNAKYFKEFIFPFISLRNRKKIIKTLVTRLTNPRIVESFFEVITELYGFHQARPFLKKCGYEFIRKCFDKYEIRLSLREIKYFYFKYPSLILEYLDLQKKEDSKYESNSYYILKTKENIQTFLPRLLKKHSTYFSKLIQKYDDLKISLNSYETFLFLKQERLELFNNPHLYLPILSLKNVTSLLPRNQLKMLIRKFFPENPRDFKFMDVCTLLKFLPPLEKLPFILEIFRDIYDRELTDFQHCVISAIEYFPVQERHIHAARLMGHNQNRIVQGGMDEEKPWRCYLPITESFIWIIRDIEACESHSKRALLFQELIFSCAMNEDFRAVLDVLRFILNRYNNMDKWIMIKIFDQITKGFDIQSYIELYWQNLYEFISRVNLRMGTNESIENIRNIVTWVIQIDLEHNRDITEKIIILTEVNEKNNVKPVWNICKHNASFEKKCLERFIKAIFSVYTLHRHRNTKVWKNAIVSFVSAMYDFKHRHEKESDIFELLPNRNHMRELKNNIEQLLRNYFSKIEKFDCRELINLLKKNKSVILETFSKQADLYNIPCAIITLKKDVNSIFSKWRMYYNVCKKNIAKRSSKIFLERIKWFQKLPRLFVCKCFKEMSVGRDKRTMKMLAIFLEDSVCHDIFKPFFTSKLAENYILASRIIEAMKYMNVPFCMVEIITLYESKCKPIIAEYFTTIERRVPVHKLIAFTKPLVSSSNSILKYIIRIFENAASSHDFQSLLWINNKWKGDSKYVETRIHIFKNIHHGFITKPSDSKWRMMQLLLNNLDQNDQADIINIITCYTGIDVRYIGFYIENLLSNSLRMKEQLNVSESLPERYSVSSILNSLSTSITHIFSEKLHVRLLKNYLTNTNLKKVRKISIHYFIQNYIMPPDDNLLNNRLQSFSQLFEEMLTYYSIGADNVDEVSNFVYVNKFLHEFKNYLMFEMPLSERREILIKLIFESFLKILTPFHDIEFYCYLRLLKLFDGQTSPRQFADKIDQILLIIIDNFSASVINEFSYYLYDFVKFFYSDKSSQLEIVERLEEHRKENNTLVASLLLSKIIAADKKIYERYRRV